MVLPLADPGAPSLEDWPIYLLALAAQFLVDFLAGAATESISLGVRPDLQLRVMLPIWRIDLVLSTIGLMAALATVHQRYACALVLPLGALMASFARDHRGRIAQTIELSSAYRNRALLLGDVIGDDDAYTGARSLGVVTLAVSVAHELKLDDEELRLVELGALLHDVGKIAIPKEIINKPGPLDEDEWQIVRTHTLVGQQMLDRVGGGLAEVGEVVRSSHEWYDGHGYPDRNAAGSIPPEPDRERRRRLQRHDDRPPLPRRPAGGGGDPPAARPLGPAVRPRRRRRAGRRAHPSGPAPRARSPRVPALD